jgi:predicted Rossmann-fold nucleotide-binding protein
MGSEFWACMMEFLEKSLLVEKTIDPDDVRLFRITDSPQEAVALIKNVEHQDAGQG